MKRHMPAITLALALAATAARAADGEGAPRTHYVDVTKGGVLGGLATAATAYIYSLTKRRVQLSPQPLDVREVPDVATKADIRDLVSRLKDMEAALRKDIDGKVPAALCHDRHARLDAQVSECFNKSNKALLDAQKFEGAVNTLSTLMMSIDKKFDVILARGGK